MWPFLFFFYACTMPFEALASNVYSYTSLSKFDYIAKQPKFSSMIRSGGRPTERQIYSLAEAGYATILSVSEFPTDDFLFYGVEDKFPSSSNEKSIGESLGIKVRTLNGQFNSEFASEVSLLLSTLPKPIYTLSCKHLFIMHSF